MNAERHIVTCNGRRLPLAPTGTLRRVRRRRALQGVEAASSLHPNIDVHAPLTFDVYRCLERPFARRLHLSRRHPGGRNYETFPVNSYEAEARRLRASKARPYARPSSASTRKNVGRVSDDARPAASVEPNSRHVSSLDSAPDESPRRKHHQLLLSGYRPLPGAIDEMMDAQAGVRAHWRPFLAMLGRAGPEFIDRRFGEADRYLHDSGVSYRLYEARRRERTWPLAHVPLLSIMPIGARWRPAWSSAPPWWNASWPTSMATAISSGRARLPATLIAGNPDFLRPLVGITPPGGAFLRLRRRFGRAPDGRWWVLGDRTQAPSGMGYALENRLALSRAFRSSTAAQVERVARSSRR